MKSGSLIGIVLLVFTLLSSPGLADNSCWRTCHTEAEALCREGVWDEAFQRSKAALNLARTKYGVLHLNTAKSLETLGDICTASGRLQQSNLYLNEAVKIRSKLYGDCHPSVIRLLTMMADNFRMHRQWDQAEQLYRKALYLADTGGWGQSSDAAPALEGLARLHSDRGENQSAQTLYQKAIVIYELGEKYRPAEKQSEARCLVNLADLKFENKDFSEARELYEAALTKYLGAAGPRSPMIAYSYKRLADSYARRGMPSVALTYFHRALGAYERTGLPDGPLTAATLVGLANVLKSKGKQDESQQLYRGANAIYERTGGLDGELATMVLTKERIWPGH